MKTLRPRIVYNFALLHYTKFHRQSGSRGLGFEGAGEAQYQHNELIDNVVEFIEPKIQQMPHYRLLADRKCKINQLFQSYV